MGFVANSVRSFYIAHKLTKTNKHCAFLGVNSETVHLCLDCISNGDMCAKVGPLEYISYLGVELDKELKWKNHFENVKQKLVINIVRLFYFLRRS